MRTPLPHVAAGAVAVTALSAFALGLGGMRSLEGDVDAAAAQRADRVEHVRRLPAQLSERPVRDPRHHRSARAGS